MRAFRFDGEVQFHRSRFVLIKSTLRATPQFFRIFSAYCNRISLIRPIRVFRGAEGSSDIRFDRKPSAQSLSKRKLDPLTSPSSGGIPRPSGFCGQAGIRSSGHAEGGRRLARMRSSWLANACRSFPLNGGGPPPTTPSPRSPSIRFRIVNRSPIFSCV